MDIVAIATDGFISAGGGGVTVVEVEGFSVDVSDIEYQMMIDDDEIVIVVDDDEVAVVDDSSVIIQIDDDYDIGIE